MADVIADKNTGENQSNGPIISEDTAQNGNNPTEPGAVISTDYISINDAPMRPKNKSIYQRYEEKVPKKQRNIIANLVSALMILSLWSLFVIPSALMLYALADYYLDRLDPFVSLSLYCMCKKECSQQ